jgi:hypothetical protein
MPALPFLVESVGTKSGPPEDAVLHFAQIKTGTHKSDVVSISASRLRALYNTILPALRAKDEAQFWIFISGTKVYNPSFPSTVVSRAVTTDNMLLPATGDAFPLFDGVFQGISHLATGGVIQIPASIQEVRAIRDAAIRQSDLEDDIIATKRAAAEPDIALGSEMLQEHSSRRLKLFAMHTRAEGSRVSRCFRIPPELPSSDDLPRTSDRVMWTYIRFCMDKWIEEQAGEYIASRVIPDRLEVDHSTFMQAMDAVRAGQSSFIAGFCHQHTDYLVRLTNRAPRMMSQDDTTRHDHTMHPTPICSVLPSIHLMP